MECRVRGNSGISGVLKEPLKFKQIILTVW